MKGDFLDFTKEHKLSESECELISCFRFLSQEQQQSILQLALHLVSKEIPIDEN